MEVKHFALAMAAAFTLWAGAATAQVSFTFDCDLEGWGANTGSSPIAFGDQAIVQTYADGAPFDPIVQVGGLEIDGSQLQEVAVSITIEGWPSDLPIAFFFFSANGVTQTPLGEFGDGTHVIRFNPATASQGNPSDINWEEETINVIRFDFPDGSSFADLENASVTIDWVSVSDDPNFTPTQTPLEDTDCDGDGLTYSDEQGIGTDPNDADSDGDGLNDGTENAGATDPLNADTDGDGVEDGLEVQFGFDPLDPNNTPNLPASTPWSLIVLSLLVGGAAVTFVARRFARSN